MLEKNSEYTVKIDSVSSDGNGVCRINGMAVFVPYTAAGDEVKIKITNVKKRFAEGVLTEITSPSPDRTKPDCPQYEQCGGCQLRHIKYEKQLEIKKSIVENAMRRLGGFKDFSIEEIIGMENPTRYRNKTIFHADRNKIGFYSQKSHVVVPVSDCAIGMEENAAIIRATADFDIKEIFTRKSFSTGEIMVVVTADIADSDRLVKSLLSACGKITSVYLNDEKIYGTDTITDTLGGIKFKISPESFFQVNPVQTEKLYSKVLEYANLDKTMTVMDIYCGIGTISLCAAKKTKSVIGIEVVERAIEDAKENAKINGITNTEFYAGSAEKIVPYLIKSGETPDVVILDPPRKGIDEKTLGAIVKAKPKRIVYVSCNPATLARDARFLSDNGYSITRAAAVDLFPHTSHVETVLLMSRQKSEHEKYGEYFMSRTAADIMEEYSEQHDEWR